MNPLPIRHGTSLPPWLDRIARLIERVPAAALSVIPIAFFVLMVIGLVRWYSPVPFWDMWDAYLAGYIAYLDGDWRWLFAQTNEHRIWFSNVLFFLDLRFLNGRSLLLIPANVALVLALWLTLGLISRALLKDTPRLWPVVSLALGPLCLSWLQEQNLSWGFQSQFFVAYLFPLVAFACLGLSDRSPHGRAWFVASLLFGLLSLGTMANGIAVLPLLVFMNLAMPRVSWRRTFIIVVVAVLSIAAWFQGYFTVARDHASLTQAATFVLTFFGLPVGEMLGSEKASYVAGTFFIVSTGGFTLFWLRTRTIESPLVLSLVAFLIYVGLSCAVIALGRAAIQPNAALVSRYATPSLMAWCALAILFAYLFRHQRNVRSVTIVLGILAAAGLWSAQRQVFRDTGPELVHQRMVGALALKMRVADRRAIGAIYPTDTDEAFNHVRTVADMAEVKKLSVMADPDLTFAVGQIGKPAGQGFHECAGALDQSEDIDGEPNYVRVSGWVFDEKARRVPAYAYIGVNGVIEGLAAAGGVRRDVAGVRGEPAVRSGFTGFLRGVIAENASTLYCADEP
ncbi:MAG: hypothetical protein LCH56_02690 [Proteobacteria bacterium]|nr:hypothetical protein [Pseudomonadota bacterium]